ncbi:MAG: hypothetical protein KKG75_03110 [Nanoarchaeota archaeon]|nr:hypothetical protein [Nanoarchaeota archaeon]
MPPKKKSKVIHAQVSNPVLVRKTILETSILSLENLKILKNIKQIKRRKAKLKTELRKLCKEMQDQSLIFEGKIPSPDEVGISPEKETEKEIRKVAREEGRKRKSQEKLMVKTTKKEENPFEQKDQLDFDIEKLKSKIKGL